MNRRGLLKSLAGIVAGAVGWKAVPSIASAGAIPPIGAPHPQMFTCTVTYSAVKAVRGDDGWVQLFPYDRVDVIQVPFLPQPLMGEPCEEVVTLYYDPPELRT